MASVDCTSRHYTGGDTGEAAIAKNHEPYSPTQILFDQVEDNYSSLPTLKGTYLHFFLCGALGGHHDYLQNYRHTRAYRIIAGTIVLLPIVDMVIIAAIGAANNSDGAYVIVAACALVGFLAWALAIFVLFLLLLYDFCQLPGLHRSLIANGKFVVSHVEQICCTPLLAHPDFDSDVYHRDYHTEVNRYTRSVKRAIITLLILGVVGEHKRYLGQPQQAMVYCRLAGIICWSLVVFCTFLMFMGKSVVLIMGGAITGIATILFSLFLAIRLIGDALAMPKKVANNNLRVQKELASKYLVRAMNQSLAGPDEQAQQCL